MAGVNHFCDHPKCCNAPVAFGFQKEGVKMKICSEHVMDAVIKHMSIFEIALFDFIDSVKDVLLYEERKELRHKGIAALDILEVKCEEEWLSGQERLTANYTQLNDALIQTYQEMLENIKKTYDEIKQNIIQTRANLDKLMQDKAFSLTSEDWKLCETVPTASPFRVILGDSRGEVVEVVMRNCHVTFDVNGDEEVQGVRSDMGTDVRELGVAGGESPAVEQHQETGPNEVEASLAAGECLSTAQLQVKRGEYDAAIEELKKGRSLLQQSNLQNSELWRQLSNSLAETLHQTNTNMNECAEICKEVLQACEQHSDSFELWRALFWFACRKSITESAAIEKWKGMLRVESPVCECVRLYTEGELLYWKGESQKAVKKLEEGLKLGKTLLPDAYMTACCLTDLARLYHFVTTKVSNCEQYYTQACDVLSVHFPYSYYYALALTNQGYRDRNKERLEQAGERLQHAYDLLSTRYTESWCFGVCLYYNGLLYESLNRIPEAALALEQALPILKKNNSSELKGCEAAINSLRYR